MWGDPLKNSVLVLCLGLALVFSGCTATAAPAGEERLNEVYPLEYAEQISIGSRSYPLADVDQTGGETVKASDSNQFQNVTLTGVDLAALAEEELEVLFAQVSYCQAMCDADVDALRALVAEDKTFTHMSGRVQTREEYFGDIANGSLNYFSIGMEDPVVTVSGSHATVRYTREELSELM